MFWLDSIFILFVPRFVRLKWQQFSKCCLPKSRKYVNVNKWTDWKFTSYSAYKKRVARQTESTLVQLILCCYVQSVLLWIFPVQECKNLAVRSATKDVDMTKMHKNRLCTKIILKSFRMLNFFECSAIKTARN